MEKISTEPMADKRLLLKFYAKGFDEAFSAQQMSDGTLKVFAYLLLPADPDPSPFLCIEEPENGLYHKLPEVLAQQFRAYASEGKKQMLLNDLPAIIARVCQRFDHRYVGADRRCCLQRRHQEVGRQKSIWAGDMTISADASYSIRPSQYHHLRMYSTAKTAVSLLIPTFTKPWLANTS